MTNFNTMFLNDDSSIFIFKENYSSEKINTFNHLSNLVGKKFTDLITNFLGEVKPLNYYVCVDKNLLGISIIVINEKDSYTVLDHYNYHNLRNDIQHTHSTIYKGDKDTMEPVIKVNLKSTLDSIKRLNEIN